MLSRRSSKNSRATKGLLLALLCSAGLLFYGVFATSEATKRKQKDEENAEQSIGRDSGDTRLLGKECNEVNSNDSLNRKDKLTIWIFNHYATNMFINSDGRHHMLAKHLMEQGYDVTIFCASTVHNSDVNLINDSNGPSFKVDYNDAIPYVFIKCRNYKGNGSERVLNMLDYYRGIMRNHDRFSSPDVIIGSSVHPLASYAAIKLAKQYGCKSIVEIRDLWPLSLEAYGIIPDGRVVAKTLYCFERYLYEEANALVFTMQGGAQYIIDKGWDVGHGGKIELDKVYNINNGVDLPTFDSNAERFSFDCDEFHIDDAPIVMYAGSIRRVNNLSRLVDVASVMKGENVRFIVFGDGDELKRLRKRVVEEGLTNIHFLGRIAKEQIPSALHHADILICLGNPEGVCALTKYGNSNNKLFEYLASGRPLLYGFRANPPIIDENDCGIEMDLDRPEDIAQTIRKMLEDTNKTEKWKSNARLTAEKYSYERLAGDLSAIIDNLDKEKK